MNLEDFDFRYSPEKELPGREYWQLLEISSDDIQESLGGALSPIANLLEKIQDNTLRDKLKEKLVSLLDFENAFFVNYLDSKVFSPDEIKQVFELALNTRLNNYSGQYSGQILLGYLEDTIYLVRRIDDPEWQSNALSKIFDLLDSQDKDSFSNISKSISDLIICIKNPDIRNAFVSRYSKALSQEYLDLIRISGNPNYIKEKSKHFEDVSIGIDSRITIGAEIELNHSTFGMGGFDLSSQSNIGLYRSDTDATVPNGKEFISPIFHDTPEELSVFCAVCETLKELRYEASDVNVSGQINIGIDYLDTAESLLQFWELFCNSEELLYHICNPEGSVMRQPVYNNSRFKAISGAIGTREIDEDISRDEVISMLSPDNPSSLPGVNFKKNSICLRDKNRFEIRIPNGSEDYQVWIDNIRLFAKMVEVSKGLASAQEGYETSETDVKKLELKESLKDEDMSLEEKLFILMDLLFDDDKTKQLYVNRFYSLEQEIQKNLTTYYIYAPTGIHSDSSFGIVDFLRVYSSQINRSEDGSLNLPNIMAPSRVNEYYYE